MTPYEHYREAERIIALFEDGSKMAVDQQIAGAALAQVHATLARCHMTAGVWSEDKP